MHNIRLIVNPTAGKGWALEVAKQASHLLDKWGLNHKFLYSRSPDDPARVGAMLRNAKNGCWVRAADANPTPFEEKLTLNGKVFDLG